MKAVSKKKVAVQIKTAKSAAVQKVTANNAKKKPVVKPVPAAKKPAVKPAPATKKPVVKPAPATKKPAVKAAPAAKKPVAKTAVKSPVAKAAPAAKKPVAKIAVEPPVAKTVKPAPVKKIAVPVKKSAAKTAEIPALRKSADPKEQQIHDELHHENHIKKNKLSKAEKEFFHELLVHERAKFGTQLKFHADEALASRKESGGRVGMATHMADLGSDNFRHDFELGLLSGEADVMEMIDEALQRLEDSEYGVCLDCGQKIPRERLIAKPYARYCVRCKSARERTEEGYSRR